MLFTSLSAFTVVADQRTDCYWVHFIMRDEVVFLF